MGTATPIIELRDVSFSYDRGRDKALDAVSLSIGSGEFVGVIGPSGAGKSTLAAVMSGAIPHHFSGQLFGATLVDGHDTCDVTLTDISRLVGSVLQDIDAQMVASVVEDEMLFGLENFGVPHDKIEERLAGALASVGISDLRDREIATLSGGQKQKVAIAAILALEPRVLVLDEPTAALDPASSRHVFDILRQVNERMGITIVVIEQKVALLSEYCARVVVMEKGRVAFDGTPHEVFAHGEELRAMGVDSPRVARISNSLARRGLIEPGLPCLNVAEATSLVAGLVGPDAREVGASRAPAASPHAPAARPHAEGAEPIVELAGVNFTYPGGGASVRDLAMRVYPGELVARPRSPSCSTACSNPARARFASPAFRPQRCPRAPSPPTVPRSSRTPTTRSARTRCSRRLPLASNSTGSTRRRPTSAPPRSPSALACPPTRRPSRSRAASARWWPSRASWSASPRWCCSTSPRAASTTASA